MMTKSELIREVANYIRSTASNISHVEIGMGSRVMRIDIAESVREDKPGVDICEEQADESGTPETHN